MSERALPPELHAEDEDDGDEDEGRSPPPTDQMLPSSNTARSCESVPCVGNRLQNRVVKNGLQIRIKSRYRTVQRFSVLGMTF